MEVILVPDPRLEAGTAAVRLGYSDVATGSFRLGYRVVTVRLVEQAAVDGEMRLAPDVWEGLRVPYKGIRVRVRQSAQGEIELGPFVVIYYTGDRNRFSQATLQEIGTMYFGHLSGSAGVLAIGFEESTDWEAESINGYILDNRPGRQGNLVEGCFPIPAVVRLTWAHTRSVIHRLRAMTGGRCFNWVRNIGKWDFYQRLQSVDGVREHLPETQRYYGPADLIAMLVRFETIFVKHVFSIRGQRVVRVRHLPEGFQVSYMENGKPAGVSLESLDAVVSFLKEYLGTGRWVLQQGIETAGGRKRAMHVRVVVGRTREAAWRELVTVAHVAPDERLPFTNSANGAMELEILEVLRTQREMTESQAKACVAQMREISLRAAAALSGPFHPLGIIGFDLLIDAGNHRVWLLEGNSVPGWGYGPERDRELARSQSDYALFLTGFPAAADRQPD